MDTTLMPPYQRQYLMTRQPPVVSFDMHKAALSALTGEADCRHACHAAGCARLARHAMRCRRLIGPLRCAILLVRKAMPYRRVRCRWPPADATAAPFPLKMGISMILALLAIATADKPRSSLSTVGRLAPLCAVIFRRHAAAHTLAFRAAGATPPSPSDIF